MKENKMVEMVVLFNGNFIPIPVERNKITEFETMLEKCCSEGHSNPYAFFRFGTATILSKSIDGWYFREIPVNTASKLLNILDKATGDGEDWKNN
jgi:hypothetical protein